jgi:hypothetical protein
MQTKLFRLAFCFALVTPLLATADKVDDFKEAASKTGYREAVMNVFSYATDKIRGDASSDEALRPYTHTLLNEWAGEIGDHRGQITEKGNAIETCKAERP